MEIFLHADGKEKKKKKKKKTCRFLILHFYWSCPSDAIAVKGLREAVAFIQVV